MYYKDARNCGKAILKFVCQNYYDDPDSFLEKADRVYPGTHFEILRNDDPITHRIIITISAQSKKYGDPTRIYMKLGININDMGKYQPPEVLDFAIQGAEDEPDDKEKIKLEIFDAIEEKIQEMQQFCFSDNDVSEAMLDVTKSLVSQWTLPDDRDEFTNPIPAIGKILFEKFYDIFKEKSGIPKPMFESPPFKREMMAEFHAPEKPVIGTSKPTKPKEGDVFIDPESHKVSIYQIERGWVTI